MDAGLVISAPGDDEVGKLFGRFDELLVHGFEHSLIAVEHLINSTSALHYIAADIANKTHVGVGINENLQVHHVAQLLIVQRHDAFEDNDRLRLYMDGFRQTVGDDVRIGRLFYCLTI